MKSDDLKIINIFYKNYYNKLFNYNQFDLEIEINIFQIYYNEVDFLKKQVIKIPMQDGYGDTIKRAGLAELFKKGITPKEYLDWHELDKLKLIHIKFINLGNHLKKDMISQGVSFESSCYSN